jgi:hypothetical protein
MVSASDRARLEAIASDRNRPQKYAERARMVLASMAGDPVQRIATQVGIRKPFVWKASAIAILAKLDRLPL